MDLLPKPRRPAAASLPAIEGVLLKARDRRAPIELRLGDGTRVPASLAGPESGELRVVVLEPGRPDQLPDAAAIRAIVHLDGRAWEFEADAARVDGGAELKNPRRLRAAQRRSSSRIPAAAGSTVLFSSGERVLRRPIIDLAASGLGVAFTGEAVEPVAGAALGQLRFTLPLGAPILAAGVVRHIRARASDGLWVAGLDLMGLSVADARRLDAWVRGQTRTRKREDATRARDIFSTSNAVLHGPAGRSRSRSVVDVHARGITLLLGDGDRDLAEGASLRRVELWHEGVCVIAAEAEVEEVVSHRSRPIHAQLGWRGARPDELARLARLLRRLGR